MQADKWPLLHAGSATGATCSLVAFLCVLLLVQETHILHQEARLLCSLNGLGTAALAHNVNHLKHHL